MKPLTSAAIVALTAAVIGAGGLATSASAQQAPNQPNQLQMPNGPGHGHGQFNQRFQFHDMRPNQGGPRMGALLDLVCSERGAEQLEIAFVRMSHRLDITAEQQPLFDDLKATALTAQTKFADDCSAARRTASDQAAAQQAPAPVDLLERMQTRIDLEKAHVAALETVLPKFEAFYNALSDEQKAQLQPRQRRNGPPQQMGQMPMQPGMMEPGQPGMMEPGQDNMMAPPPPAGATNG